MKQFKKIFIIWFLVIAILHLIMRLGAIAGPWQGYTGLVSAAVLLYPPLFLNWNKKGELKYLNFNVARLPHDVVVLVVTCLVVFPALALANHFFQDFAFQARYKGLPQTAWLTYFINQLVMVALPEEVFFRGYLERELSKIFPLRSKIFGAPFGVACVLNAVVFAFSHSLITFQWWHFSIFFPALVFSWLRQKTGTLWMPVVFHALSNLFSYAVYLGYG